jgi:hypothetical protein
MACPTLREVFESLVDQLLEVGASWGPGYGGYNRSPQGA